MQEKYSLEQELFDKISQLDDIKQQLQGARFQIELIRSVLIEV